MGKARIGLQALALASVAALALSACGGGGGGQTGGSASTPTKGQTLTFLTSSDKLQHLDPQLVYTGEDAAFLDAYAQRTLVTYTTSPDQKKSLELVGDLATDIGKKSPDGKTWTFTLKNGLKWENGNPLTCEDVKYGISRSFATDVISGGPTYQIQMLDIPKNADGSSQYKGPYVKNNNQALYDKAVVCSGYTITFHLNRPASDWNYATTWGMGPVPKAADTGAKYDLKPLSNGPYKIQESTPNQQLVLVRNDNWDPKTDPTRPAYPDKIVTKYSVQSEEIDQRMIQNAGVDQQASSRDQLGQSQLAAVFNDDQYKDRRVNAYDAYTNYIAIRADKIKNLKIRQAVAAALDRAQIKTVWGGDFAGDLADGVVKPNLPADYAPSGLWDTLLGQKIPDSGDPNYAKQLIQQSGQAAPTLTYQYRSGVPARAKQAGVVKESLEKAGFKVTLQPLPRGDFYTIVFDPQKAADLIDLGWGPDWPNAVTVLPQLFTPTGAWNLSQVNDPKLNQMAAKATTELDRNKQSQMWKDLNKYAMQQAYAVPTLFLKQQRLSGSKVHSVSGPNGDLYIWPPAGAWPYPDMWVAQ